MNNELIPGEFASSGSEQKVKSPASQEPDNKNTISEAQDLPEKRPEPNLPSGWRAYLKSKHKYMLIFWVLMAIATFSYINYFHKDIFNKIWPGYAEAYTLVNDKISQSAVIAINPLPQVSKEDMKNGVTFIPEIKGEWLADNNSDQNKIYFRPAAKLELGKYYTVSASTSQGVISKDFYVDEDPRVESIFPRSDSEASEQTAITIIFNRPMVPLSGLDTEAKKNIPVVISPATRGSFKWISTRVLQFTGESGLIPSANYTVMIRPEFISMDGLTVGEFKSSFSTKHLRLENSSTGVVSYREPISVHFNQPVNLNKTSNEIELRQTSRDQKETLEFITEFGNKKIYNQDKKKYEEVVDNSTINIYLKKDRFGREKFWDYDTNYYLTVKKAYPQEGDIDLNTTTEVSVKSSNLIKAISATSDRTPDVSQDLYDPQGKLALQFFEDIDLSKSLIKSDKIDKIEYGKKCEGEASGLYISEDVECNKVPDNTKLIISFKSDEVSLGEILKIELVDVYNAEGMKINNELVTKEIKSFGSLRVISTTPQDKSNNAELSQLILCTNNPLVPPEQKDWRSLITAKLDFEIKDWGNSYQVKSSDSLAYFKCQPGEFETKLSMGFMPETDYSLNIKLNDVFGQAIDQDISFQTGQMPNKFLNFYHYQKTYSVSSPEKTRLTYSTENMDYVNVHICQLSAEDMMYYLNNKPDYWEGPGVVTRCQKVAEARIDQPKKYWIKNYFRIDIKDYFPEPTGNYILTFTNPNYFDRNSQPKRVYERTYLTVSNLSVVEKREEMWIDKENQDYNLTNQERQKLKNIYWVSNIKSLDPVAGAEVTLYQENTGSKDSVILNTAGTYKTNERGIAETPVFDKMNGVVVKSGADSALITDVIDKLDWGSNAYNAQMMYLYTDRPIYRPGHKIYFKGIYRIGYDGNYEIFKDKKIPVSLYDSNNKEIYQVDLDINDFGTFNGEFTLDQNAPLGQYRLEAKQVGYAFFDVEEYTPSAFKIDAKTDKEEYISGDTFNLDIDASYYFGAPVEGGTVEYSLGSQNYYFDKYKDEWFNFGSGWYSCYYGCSYGDMFILRGKGELDSNGHIRIAQSLDINKLFKNADDRTSKIFTVYATVKNSAGQSVSTQKSFIYHAGEFYLGVNLSKTFLAKDESSTIKIKSVDTEGKTLPVKDIKLKIDKVKWVYAQRQEVDGGYYYQWEKKLENVQEKDLNTDSNGNWSGDFSLSQTGEYEINITATDKRGNNITGNQSFYVYGSGQVDVRPSNDDRVEVVTDKQTLDVGEEGSLIIKSPYAKARALISIERGQIFDYQIIDINESLYKFTFPIKEEYIPNVYVSVTLLSDKPELKYGSQGFNINTKEKELIISVKSDKTTYLPGEGVILDFEAHDSKGNPVEAEFSAAVVDMSVLALKGNPKKNPVVFFYNYFPLTVSTVSNLKNVLFEADVPVSTKGGGGNEAEDLARKKRGEFKDTAFWQADIKTDSNGKATIRFALPDNLTTWQLESLGVTRDTKLGVDYEEFMAKKKVMAVPLKPRFIIPGDDFYVGATVFNQTEDKQKLTVKLSSQSLTIKDNPEQTIKLDAGKSETVYFAVSAPIDMIFGQHEFTISAKNDSYEDVVDSLIPVNPNETGEVVSVADNSTAEWHREYVLVPAEADKTRGQVTVNTSASLSGILAGGLKSIFTNPYDNNSDIIEKLTAVAVVKQGLGLGNLSADFGTNGILFEGKKYKADDFVPLAMERLYQNYQKNNFAYYRGGTPNFYLTIGAFNALKKIKAAGYPINEEMMRNLFTQINDRINFDKGLQSDPDEQIITARTIVDSHYGALNKTLVSRIKGMENDEKLLKEDLSRNTLAILAQLVTVSQDIFGKTFKEKVFKTLDNDIEIDSRGAFVGSNNNSIWQYYETPVRNTALALEANILAKRGQDINDRLLRWLVRGRDVEGAWSSTANSLSVAEAMIDYLKWQGENKSDFQLELLLNGENRSSYSYARANFLEQNISVVPITDLGSSIMSYFDFHKTDRNQAVNRYYYDMSLEYYLPADRIAPCDEGLTIKRSLFALDDKEGNKALNEAKIGDVVRGHLQLIAPKQRNFVVIEDYIPAGFELVNFNLETSDSALLMEEYGSNDQPIDWEKEWYDNNVKLWPDDVQMRDDRLYLFKESLPEGEYEYDYYLRALVPGEFRRPPVVASEKYFPENFGRTAGEIVKIDK